MEVEVKEFDFHEFTDAISSMTELLDQEAQFLSGMQIRKLADMQDKKHELTTRLELQQAALNSNPAIFKKLSNAQVDQLRQYSARFNSSMKSYSEQLYKSAKTNEIVVKMIVDTIKEQVRTKNTYRNYGMSKAQRQDEFMPAVKYNEQL